MKTLKLSTVANQIKDGKIECLTDLKIGYVEIRRASGKREIIQVI